MTMMDSKMADLTAPHFWTEINSAQMKVVKTGLMTAPGMGSY